MNQRIRYCLALKAAALATGICVGTAFHALADEAAISAADTCTSTRSDVSQEAPFLAENTAAMRKMMTDMAVTPTGDVDADFVAMMVPHHQGAIEMALAVLRHGRNPRIRRLAQEIVVTQQQEIAAMRLAIGQPLPPSVPSPTQPSPMPAHTPRTTQ
jgi:uncharacterized protein (DUF305 family)